MTIFETFANVRSLTLDVVLEPGQTPESAAERLASTLGADGNVTWKIERVHGPAGEWPTIRFDAVESIDDDTAQRALFAIHQRWNGE